MEWIISEKCWKSSRHGNVPEEDLIKLSKNDFDDLMSEYKKGGKKFEVVGGKLVLEQLEVPSEEFELQQELNIESLNFLYTSDWKIIRELERMFLKDTDLNKQREEYRNRIIR